MKLLVLSFVRHSMKFHLHTFLVIVCCLAAMGAKTCRADGWPLPIRVYFIPSGAMEPTLKIGDRLLVDLRVYDSRAPRNGELAIFKAPNAALLGSNSQNLDIDFIKRVVGTPGQTVEIVKGQLRVNGAPTSEPYVLWENSFAIDTNLIGVDGKYRYDMKIVGGAVYSREYLGSNEPGPWSQNNVVVPEADQKKISLAKSGIVPQNQFLMLGDHRSNSNDSHIWGFAPRSAFRGRAMFVFWPLSHGKFLP